MKKNNSFTGRVVLIASLSALLLSASTQAVAWERMVNTSKENIAVLATVLAFHQGEYSPSGPQIKIFELGGGDPAMNGSFIYVCIDYKSKTLIWKTGLNVRNIQRISFAQGNRIRIDVSEDFMDENASISNRKATYQVQFHIDEDVLRDEITLRDFSKKARSR